MRNLVWSLQNKIVCRIKTILVARKRKEKSKTCGPKCRKGDSLY